MITEASAHFISTSLEELKKSPKTAMLIRVRGSETFDLHVPLERYQSQLNLGDFEVLKQDVKHFIKKSGEAKEVVFISPSRRDSVIGFLFLYYNNGQTFALKPGIKPELIQASKEEEQLLFSFCGNLK